MPYIFRIIYIYLLLAMGAGYAVAAQDASAADKPSDSFYFLAMSDIHFDPFTACYHTKPRPCQLIMRLRKAPASSWASILEAEDTVKPAYRLDTNYPLLRANLDAAKKAAKENHARFVIVLGDSLGHDFRRYYKKFTGDHSQSGFENFVKKTLQFVNNELEQTFPAVSVFMVVGNNDTYSRNYQSIAGGAFFHDAGAIWSALIKDSAARSSMRKQFIDAGYYAVDVPGQSGLRLIVLNSVLFSKRSVWRNAKSAASRELDWLQRELRKAKQRKQKVLLAMHIPTALDVYATRRWRLFTFVDFWRPEYLKQFKTELSRYYPQIVAIFAGHLHYDWLQSLQVGLREDVPVIGVPAISPIFGSDPSFKIYHYVASTDSLDDYYTYYYEVDGRGTWSVEHVYDLISKQRI